MTEANHEDKYEQYRPYWAQRYEEFSEPLLDYSRKLINRVNIGEPEELVSDSVCHTLRCAPDPATVRNVRGYLFWSLHNVWVDGVKKSIRQNSMLGKMDSIDDPDSRKKMENQLPKIDPEVLSILKKKEFLQELQKLGPLTPKENSLLTSIIKGYTLEEVAKFYGEDICRTKSRWYALVNKLRYRWRARNNRPPSNDQT